MPNIERITGVTFTAQPINGKWYPTKINLGTGESTTLMFGYELRDDAIAYALDNFAVDGAVNIDNTRHLPQPTR